MEQDLKKTPETVKELLGYLNFSSGERNLRFFQCINQCFAETADSFHASAHEHQDTTEQKCLAVSVIEYLEDKLLELSQESPAFKTDDQAGLILRLVREHFLPSYREFHRDLLHHQKDNTIFNPFFLAKIFETVLKQGAPWTETERIIKAAVSTLNDYIGYRPVPVLEGDEKHQPYMHEWVAPVPLYMNGAGTACGRYQKVVDRALQILRETDPQILHEACLDPDKLQELVLDPRAYDFDHPINRKPNYHFGIWDPLFIDNKGDYRRFVVHQVTLDGILYRLESACMGESDAASIPPDELLYEAGSVLAGTMLMGSGVCGDNPQTYDSETSLGSLMPLIAGYRDKFYEQIIEKIPDEMKLRILEEKERLFQSFGGCRQSLNRQLAKRRADQLQRISLARIFAQMGYSEAATEQTKIIAVPSARITTEIDCLITDAHLLIDQEQLQQAAENIPKIEDLIRRGINCGAIVDPWTILGFGGNYSLFHNIENAIHDHRIDDLIDLMEDVFDLYSRLQKEAAASGNNDLQADLSDKMSDLAGWWDQYGSTEINGLDSFSGSDTWESAAVVSTALAVWHKAGSAAGDIAFWNRHVERFKSAKAYVLLVMALLDQQDMVAAMALMMHWLSHSETVPLSEGDYSFHPIALRWLEQLWEEDNPSVPSNLPRVKRKTDIPPLSNEERWKLTNKFFDYLEANADDYWSAPAIEIDGSMFEDGESDDKSKRPKKGQDKTQDGDVYSAAYENVVYQDSTDDGVDDFMMDAPDPTGKYNDGDDDELANETERISDRLTFIVTMSKLWKFTVEKAAGSKLNYPSEPQGNITAPFTEYLKQARYYGDGLDSLLRKVAKYKIPPPRGTADSLLEYDRHRGTKEILMDRIVWTNVELNDAKMLLQAFLGRKHWLDNIGDWEKSVQGIVHAVFQSDMDSVEQHWSWTLQVLAKETILYIPTSRGGTPWAIVRCRSVQQALMRLMEYVPRLGLLAETFQLLGTVKTMEEENTVSPGAITEFDRLVETATRAVTKCVAVSSKSWRFNKSDAKGLVPQDAALVDYMEQIVELLLSGWLAHSRQIRISPVESLLDRSNWDAIKQFIQQYGHDIFTQQNMGFGNLRAILHQGVGVYLQSLMKMKLDNEENEMASELLEDISRKRVDLNVAASHLELILEAVAENYSEYVDYNSTTTHSDHGEKLYMLLDMLRVQVGYDRIAWNLKPVYWIHDELIRNGCHGAAMLWEQAVERRSIASADEYMRQYNRLSEKYGMWLPSVNERLQERFVRPLQIDRMCGLVPKAVKQIRANEPKTAFKELNHIIEIFAKEPLGVGFEMPEWLNALQEEVSATRTDTVESEPDKDIFRSSPHIEQVCITRSQLDKVLEQLTKKERFA